MGSDTGQLGTAYIAGPMRDFDQFNFPAFFDAAADLRSAGWTVLSPAERDIAEGFDPTLNTLDNFDVEAALAADFAMILRSDAIVLLPGWENSRGARAERFVAEQVGKQVLKFDPMSSVWTSAADPWDGNPHPAHTHTTETRITDPVTGGQKGVKQQQLGALDPLALLELASVAGFGGAKYARYNFLLGYDWSASFDALQRHALAFWSGEDRDPESGFPHMAHVAWHGLALTAFLLRGRGTDDRPV